MCSYIKPIITYLLRISPEKAGLCNLQATTELQTNYGGIVRKSSLNHLFQKRAPASPISMEDSVLKRYSWWGGKNCESLPRNSLFLYLSMCTSGNCLLQLTYKDVLS